MPGKVLKPILGRPMLWHIVRRLRHVPGLSSVIVATSELPGDEPVRTFCRESGIPVFAGSEEDVLDRFYQAALHHRGDPLVRITGDCPFVDPELVGRLLRFQWEGGYDHAGIATGAGAIFLTEGRFPDGLDAECLRFSALERAWREAEDKRDREHVTPYIWRNKALFLCGQLTADKDYSRLRWTVDNEEDFAVVEKVYEALYREEAPFLMADILAYLKDHPELSESNRGFIGKEGYAELWKAGKTRNSKEKGKRS
jgi:spore coat polysaccharide biosynthesis protein SpsF (cytidylyltransferase family)